MLWLSARRPIPPSYLLRHRARDWGAWVVRGDTNERQSRTCEWGSRGRALSRVQRPPQWRAARAGGADATPT